MNLKVCVRKNEAKIRKVAKEREKIKKYIENILLKAKIEYRYIPFTLQSDDNLMQVRVCYPAISADEFIIENEAFKSDSSNNIIHTYSMEVQNEVMMNVEETAYICNLIRGEYGVMSMKNKPVFVTKIHYVVCISNSEFEFDREFKLSEITNGLDFTKKVKVYKDNTLYNKQYEKYVRFLNYNFCMPEPISLEELLTMNRKRIKVNNNIELEIAVSKSDATLQMYCETDELLARFDAVKSVCNKVTVYIIKLRTGEIFKEEFEWITVDEDEELRNGITTEKLIELMNIE